MAYTGADLLQLQGNIKRDPAGYSDEFTLQWRHYQACLSLFQLQPGQGSHEFQDLVTFISHCCGCYPDLTPTFVQDITSLLDTHGPVVDPPLRQALVKALILMRNKQQLSPTALLPVLFRLFKVPDKALRQLVFRHITADIKAANKKGRNDRLNRAVQNFLYSVLADEHEGTAKRGLAVLIEMWRRHVWRDARTVNVIASATLHRSARIMLAALKFFMGQDEEEADAGSDSEEESTHIGKVVVAGPTKEEVYKAFKKGTNSSKKKKQKKLARVMLSVKRNARREAGTRHDTFAALQLLHDPQGFADKLFARLRNGSERFETRLAMVNVISRAVGVHKLLVLNFYPFLQKYIAPSQRDVTVVLAALVQACHEVVPPDALAPVLRQLVDQFVHDRARPEVMTIGLKTVREICTRAPLVMTPELLQDLVEYRRFRDKEVSAAARGLAALFREVAPGMLAKRDRGRGADMDAAPAAYGTARIADGVAGAELLEEAMRQGKVGPDGELLSSEDEEEEGGVGGEEAESDGLSSEDEDEEMSDAEEEDEEGDIELDSDSEEELGGSDSQGVELEEEEEEEEEEEDEEDEEEDEEEGAGLTDSEDERARKRRRVLAAPAPQQRAPPQAPKADSLATLKKQLTQAKGGADADAGTVEGADGAVPEDWGRILTQQDFASIRQLRHRKMVDTAMQKHGLKSASKRARAHDKAEEAAEEMMALQANLGVMNEQPMAPSALLGRRHARRDKEERMAMVMEGREGREFGSKSRLKKQKTGGLSNREKSKRKRLPMAARGSQVRSRMERSKQKNRPNDFKGHVRK